MASNHKLLDNLGALTGMVRRVALGAGEIIMRYYDGHEHHGASEKTDGSPVTLADQQAEKFIEDALADLLPGIPVIGEEAAARGDLPSIKEMQYFWLVDPLDGTKEFIKGGDDFTVNIGLIKDGAPILGVVYAPAQNLLYAGCMGRPALRAQEDQEKDIHVRKPHYAGLTVVASRAHGDPARLEQFLQDFKVEKVIKRGSSLKICAIAEGKADLYPRLGPTSQWDTAAAHAVLRAAGGRLTDIAGVELHYGDGVKDFLNPEFVAAGFDWREE